MLICHGAVCTVASAQLEATGNQRIDQTQVLGANEAGDSFGLALAAGDFDGDGIDDLAIAAPNEDIGAVEDAGAVFVIYGAASGLGGGRGPRLIYQGAAGVEETAEAFDRFGTSLTTGNFDNSQGDELVVGVPFEDLGTGLADAGIVQAFRGSPDGILASDDVVIQRSMIGYFADEAGVQFGVSLSRGLFWFGDFGPDLLVGVPHTPYGDYAVLAVGNSATSILDPAGDGNFGVFETVTFDGLDDQIGFAVAAGRMLDSVGYGLIYGAPYGEVGGSVTDDNGVVIAYPDLGGSPSTRTVREGPQLASGFGSALALGDFFGRGYSQVLVGAPYTDVDDGMEFHMDAGVAYVWDLELDTMTSISQGPSTLATPEANDYFGSVLATGDFDGDGYDDAAFGVPDESFAATRDGVVQVLYGGAAGLTYSGEQRWTLDILGAAPSAGDVFGSALAVGDFNGDGYDDLAIGIPGAEVDGQAGAGLVQILYGTRILFSDGFESSDASAWSTAVPAGS